MPTDIHEAAFNFFATRLKLEQESKIHFRLDTLPSRYTIRPILP
jgi:hypothetical protein